MAISAANTSRVVIFFEGSVPVFALAVSSSGFTLGTLAGARTGEYGLDATDSVVQALLTKYQAGNLPVHYVRSRVGFYETAAKHTAAGGATVSFYDEAGSSYRISQSPPDDLLAGNYFYQTTNPDEGGGQNSGESGFAGGNVPVGQPSYRRETYAARRIGSDLGHA